MPVPRPVILCILDGWALATGPANAVVEGHTPVFDRVTRECPNATLKAHVQDRVGKWKYPRWIDCVATLPKTATGKIQRIKLREGA